MAELTPLSNYLLKQSSYGVKRVIFTFSEIENIIGKKMASNARKYFLSWDNRHGKYARQNAWLDVCWRTVMVDMECEKVEFVQN
ncbi:MAG: hypothetical protein ABR954_05785 [Dehalococcoidales bacterium]